MRPWRRKEKKAENAHHHTHLSDICKLCKLSVIAEAVDHGVRALCREARKELDGKVLDATAHRVLSQLQGVIHSRHSLARLALALRVAHEEAQLFKEPAEGACRKLQ
jgi:hypothetical protein